MTVKSTSKWRTGQSGNPAGRPPGRSPVTKLRLELAAHLPAIVDRLVAAAKAGDIQAAKLILERVLPPSRAIEQPTVLHLPPNGSLTDQGRAVLAAVAAGELAPGQGSTLLTAIGALARVAEVDELEQRVQRLEGVRHGQA